jgi:hypothetical protein
MSPERFEFARAGDAAAVGKDPSAVDVFALGCVLVELVSGHLFVTAPLTADDVGKDVAVLRGYHALGEQFKRTYACEALVRNAAFLGRRLTRALEGRAPRALATLLGSMLAERPADRPKARDVAVTLGGLASGQ